MGGSLVNSKSILAYIALGVAFVCVLGVLSFMQTQRLSPVEGLWVDVENMWLENEYIGILPLGPSEIVKNPIDNATTTVDGKLSISGNDFLLLDHHENVCITLRNAENWENWNGLDVVVFGRLRKAAS